MTDADGDDLEAELARVERELRDLSGPSREFDFERRVRELRSRIWGLLTGSLSRAEIQQQVTESPRTEAERHERIRVLQRRRAELKTALEQREE